MEDLSMFKNIFKKVQPKQDRGMGAVTKKLKYRTLIEDYLYDARKIEGQALEDLYKVAKEYDDTGENTRIMPMYSNPMLQLEYAVSPDVGIGAILIDYRYVNNIECLTELANRLTEYSNGQLCLHSSFMSICYILGCVFNFTEKIEPPTTDDDDDLDIELD